MTEVIEYKGKKWLVEFEASADENGDSAVEKLDSIYPDFADFFYQGFSDDEAPVHGYFAKVVD